MSARPDGKPRATAGLRRLAGWHRSATAAGLQAGLLAVPALAAVVAAAQAQDARRGEHVFRRCLLCHVVEPGSTNAIGPPLNDVVGRRAGAIPGFQYSEIMQLAREKGLSWSEDALFRFLDKPEDFMPGTYMAFAGLEEQERHDVIAYLKQLTERNRVKPQGGTGRPPSEAPVAAPAASTAAAPPKLGGRLPPETASPAYVPNVPPTMLQKDAGAARPPERSQGTARRPAQSDEPK